MKHFKMMYIFWSIVCQEAYICQEANHCHFVAIGARVGGSRLNLSSDVYCNLYCPFSTQFVQENKLL